MGRFDGADLVHLFHHDNAVHGAGDHRVGVGLLQLLVGRVDDEFSSDAGDPDFGDGAVKRDITDGEGGGSRETGQASGMFTLSADMNGSSCVSAW